MYKRPIRWEPGETLIACSLCGFPRRYPSELKYLSDKKFYCPMHVEYRTGKTALDDARHTAEEQKRKDTEYPRITGSAVSWRES